MRLDYKWWAKLWDNLPANARLSQRPYKTKEPHKIYFTNINVVDYNYYT